MHYAIRTPAPALPQERRRRDDITGSTAEGAGGGTGTVDTDGLARCIGRSPTTTCTTTPCGAMTTTTHSGVTATTTSMSACSRPMPTTTSPATCQNTPAPPRAHQGRRHPLLLRRAPQPAN